LRRAVPSFTVEVRRRPRPATTSGPNVQSSETKPQQAALDRGAHRVAAAAFEAKKVDQSRVSVAASYPKGRILPSLLDEEPLRRLRDASKSATKSDPTSQAPKRPSVRPLKGAEQTSKPPSNLGPSSAQRAPLADKSSAASYQPSSAGSGIDVSPSHPTTAPSQLIGNSGGLTVRAKEKRQDKLPISPDGGRATPLLNDQRSKIGEDFLATPPSRLGEPSRQSRKRTILSRYVFGDELKPGERWKRRLLLTR
jgi:hypothetical protein